MWDDFLCDLASSIIILSVYDNIHKLCIQISTQEGRSLIWIFYLVPDTMLVPWKLLVEIIGGGGCPKQEFVIMLLL